VIVWQARYESLTWVDGSSIPRLDGAFCCVDVAIDQLQVRQPPVIEQCRPTFIPMITPDPE
jgi:hypothetical protein